MASEPPTQNLEVFMAAIAATGTEAAAEVGKVCAMFPELREAVLDVEASSRLLSRKIQRAVDELREAIKRRN